MGKIVYTSLEGFKANGWTVKSYTSLNPRTVDWINETTIKLLKNRSESESMAGELISKRIPTIEKQVFFRIHRRFYFLDYYWPEGRIAIEIDGTYHKDRLEKDIQRDKDFLEIGVKTIRIKGEDVRNGETISLLIEGLKKPIASIKPKHKKKKKQNKPKKFESAYRRLREHDRMKHKASWI